MKKFVKAGMLMIAVVVILAMRGFTVKADALYGMYEGASQAYPSKARMTGSN